MGRQVRDAKLESRASRARLGYQRAPYRRLIEEGLHLTYRKVKAGSGTWGLRAWTGEKYRETALGTADDHADADGTVVLSYGQAQTKAVETWRAEQHRALTGIDANAGPYTISDAMRDYEAAFVARGGKAVRSVRSIVSGHILPTLGAVECQKFTKAQVTSWFNSVAAGARLKSTKARRLVRNEKHVPCADVEAMRKRRSTANRILTVLKAALNHGHREGLIVSDTAWRSVKPFRSVDGVRTHFLRPEEAVRLIDACEGDFRALVQGALLTGCRYGELCRLRVADLQLGIGSIHIRESKGGKPRHVPLNEEGLELFKGQAMNKPLDALVFTRGGLPWKPSDQARPMKSACMVAGVESSFTFHGLRDTYASNLVMSGASIEVVAKLLGHSDSRITAKHYAHLAPSYVSDVLRSSLPSFRAGR